MRFFSYAKLSKNAVNLGRILLGIFLNKAEFNKKLKKVFNRRILLEATPAVGFRLI